MTLIIKQVHAVHVVLTTRARFAPSCARRALPASATRRHACACCTVADAPVRFVCGLLSMLSKLFDLEDYAGTYRETRNAYLKAANQLKLATGPYKAARDAYVAATATYTKSLYE